MAVWWIAQAVSAYSKISGAQRMYQAARKEDEKALADLNATPDALVGEVAGLQRQIDDERGFHSRPLNANNANYMRYVKGKG